MIQTKEFEDDLYLHWAGTSTPPLNITHVVFSSTASQPLETDTLTSDDKEFERIPLTVTKSGKKTTAKCDVIPSVGICPSTSISSIVSANQIIVSSVSSFSIGDLVFVQEVGGDKANVITNKVGSVITLKNNVNLDLVTTKLLIRGIGRYAVVYDGNNSRLSGKVRVWIPVEKFKTESTNTFPFIYSFDVKG